MATIEAATQAVVPSPPTFASRSRRNSLAQILILVVTSSGIIVCARQVPNALHWSGVQILGAATLAVSILIAELFPLHLRHRTETESFSVTDVMWTAGLLLAPHSILLLSVGSGVLASQLIRKQPVRKVAFNVGQFVLAIWAAQALFALIPHGGPLDSATWGAAAAAMALNFVVNQGLMALVISLTANESLRSVVLDSLPLDVLLAVGHVTIGIVAAVLWTLAPGGVLIAAVPVMLSYMACSGWLRSVQERDRMQDLYRAGQVLLERLETDGDFRAFLELVARMMDATEAEIVILRDDAMVIHDTSGKVSEIPSLDQDMTPVAHGRGEAVDTRQAAVIGEPWNETGVLAVYRSKPLTETERSLLEALATQVYVKLRHSAVFARTVAGEQELARIISSSSDGILVIGEDLRIRSWSPAMERITGVPAGTAVGRPLGDVLIAPAGEDDVWGFVGTSATERGERVETGSFARADGTVGWIRFSRSALRSPDGEPSGVVIVARDVSADIQAEQTKTNFIAAISHELRTPLTPLKGYLSMFATGRMAPDAEGAGESFAVMLRQTERLENLINDLLEANRMQTEQPAVRLEEVEMIALVAGAVAESAEVSGATVLFEPRASRTVASADPLRVKQVLAGLISNAVKYSPPGSPIVVETARDAGCCVVSVKDHGEGIPADLLDRIFERFYKVDNGSTRSTGGVGLGLYIAKQLVESMGGRLWVASKSGEGSTFSFSLPLLGA